MKKFLITAIMLICFAAGSFAQQSPPVIAPKPLPHHPMPGHRHHAMKHHKHHMHKMRKAEKMEMKEEKTDK